MKAIVRNRAILVGNKSLILDDNIAIPPDVEEMLRETEGMAQTAILVSIDGELTGVLAISDPLKPGAHEVISILKSMQVRSIMVTGDNWGTAKSIATEVGIETVIAESKPEQKAEKVKELQVSSKLSHFIYVCFTLVSVTYNNRYLIDRLQDIPWQWWVMASMTHQHLWQQMLEWQLVLAQTLPLRQLILS